jgi:uncharacterized membrane-anchored protein
MRLRNLVVPGVGLLVVAVMGVFIAQKERLLADGTTVLLPLAPRDPRSLFQGDYMALTYDLSPALRDDATLAADGRLVVRLDARQVGTILRVAQSGEALAADECLLRYRRRRGEIHLGAEAYFFQEGLADVFEPARYGELKVAANGESVLVGLRDSSLQVLKAPEEAEEQTVRE